MTIRSVADADAERIAHIYNHYIKHSTITFEEKLVTSDIILERIRGKTQSGFPWLVIEVDGVVEGYAYCSEWSARSAYRYTVEPSVYLSAEVSGLGYGRRLYSQLMEQLKNQGVKNALGVIALPNSASIALHESLGFRKVGEFSEVGFKFDRWISVGYWQLQL